MVKLFVLDTNVLLHNPGSLFSFEDNEVVIPIAVIEEIDNQKRRQDEIGRNARVVSQELDKMRGSGCLSTGIPLPRGGRLRIELNHQECCEEFPPGFDPRKTDNRILSVAWSLNRDFPGRVFLVSKDLNLRVKSDVLGIPAQDFYGDKINYHELYTGWGMADVTSEELDTFFREGHLEMNGRGPGRPNQFFVLKDPVSPSRSALSRFFRGELRPLVHGESTNQGIKARNKEQRFALELLLNDQVRVATLVGLAGTGKTLLAIAVGLEKVMEQKAYARLLITRPVIPLGNDLGFLPGSKEEKLRPWMQPIYDNLEFIFSNNQEPHRIIEHIMDRGLLEMEALAYIRGRSIPRQFIICDEAQNLTPHMIKTLITRVGEGTKIVFTGDPEQIDHPYLDSSSNGLSYLVEHLKDEEIAGHVTLVKGERSQVAEMGARLL
ncbi:MAG TPA: PhoH family protein [Syntrophales bacterium]|jgi:PhoH-like ATPase|nr:PhoH family protein [Syntrophales bacterium]